MVDMFDMDADDVAVSGSALMTQQAVERAGFSATVFFQSEQAAAVVNFFLYYYRPEYYGDMLLDHGDYGWPLTHGDGSPVTREDVLAALTLLAAHGLLIATMPVSVGEVRAMNEVMAASLTQLHYDLRAPSSATLFGDLAVLPESPRTSQAPEPFTWTPSTSTPFPVADLPASQACQLTFAMASTPSTCRHRLPANISVSAGVPSVGN